ncbi:MAG: pantothenate kinase [Deltaproteobacteria bacterium HGW-Deltaproteobacteria-24]|jgi:type III pantothenate kinase|nr:MAG: pantothenate kinase [Deltaproteobacteria bacterium HGW-Deltaproteobacteria-24]
MILCDIGNTSYDFLINEKHQKIFLDEDLPKLNETIYYISVNEKATAKLLSVYPSSINLETLFTFQTTYVGMGIDRKVACYGVDDAVIVDAGSAITVDIMENSQHQGGFILPGLRKFHALYAQISPKLDFDFALKQNLDKIPQNTQDAISYSILKATILPIKEIAHNKQLLFTGGDGEFLSSFFSESIYKKDLIFENMKRIMSANNCIA